MNAIEQIRRRITRLDSKALLDSLPPETSLKWKAHSAASPPVAVIIGISDKCPVYAYLTRYGDKPREVRYCLNLNSGSNGSDRAPPFRSLSQDEVIRLSLDAPFKYLTDPSKAGKRKFSILIKWYYLLKGLTHDIESDYDDFCKRFNDALKKIHAGENRRDSDSEEGSEIELQSASMDESPEYSEPRNVYGLRSVKRTATRNSRGNGALTTPTPRSNLPDSFHSAHKDPNPGEEGNSDLHTLRENLAQHKMLHLLDNIPDADGVQFADQTFLLDAQPKKLFIGRHLKTGDDINAYMVHLQRGFHEIRFYMEKGRSSTTMKAENVAKQRILHPFNKTYPKQPNILTQAERARLSLMVKWYFIAAGIATTCVLKETQAYPERFREALEYIASRMEADAPAFSPREKNGNRATREPTSVSIDEDHIQSTLAEVTPRASTIVVKTRPSTSPLSQPKLLPQMTTPSPIPYRNTPSLQKNGSGNHATITTPSEPTLRGKGTSHGIKRTAEDVAIEDMTETLLQDRTLTKEINEVDQELELLEIRHQNFVERQEFERQEFMHKFELEQKGILTKRQDIDEKRAVVRTRFKRQKLMFGGGMDE